MTLRGTWLRVGVSFTVVAGTALAEAPTTVKLADQGEPRAALVLTNEAMNYAPPAARKGRTARVSSAVDPVANERLAADEIQRYVERISGARLPIVATGEDRRSLTPVFIGRAAGEDRVAQIQSRGTDPCSFALVVGPKQIEIRGLSPQGTFCGACELLEQLGVRWFMPGDLGTVIPRSQTVAIRVQETIQVPSFPSRYLQGVSADDWEKHLRAGGLRFPSAHGVQLGQRPEKLFAEHPEYFALRDGKRSASQLCISNPEVLRLAIETTKGYFRANPQAEIVGMGANDGRGFCECPSCRALDGGDYDPFGHSESMTDRYVGFFNSVLRGIEGEFPQKRIGFYAYAAYHRPPVKVRPDKRIVPAIALITLCRLHGMNNPVCPEKGYEKWVIRAWGDLVPEVYYRGYWFNLADPGLPHFMIRRIGREVPLGKEFHVAGWRTECMTNWASSSPSFYLAHKLMWDHTASVSSIVDDYCDKFFGPAAEPMRQYIDLLDRAMDDADLHTGCVWDVSRVYDADVRGKARKALDEARARIAGDDDVYGRRIAMVATSFGFLEGFVDVMEGRSVHDYARSKRGLERMIAAREELSAATPPRITNKAEEYMNRFFAPAVLQAFERTSGKNEVLARLDEQWQFQIDPERVGESLAWWDPAVTGGNWQSLRTCSRSWSDQGLRYYKGLAWYRQTVSVPTTAAGNRVLLWMAGVDESAKVWVNGKLVGASPKGAFRPFELDASEAIRPGSPNSIVVCVTNDTLNELGTGGIMGPAFLYAPAK